MTPEQTAIMGRARQLLAEAKQRGFNPALRPWEQPLGLYDLWASADKALANANCGFISDAHSYLKDAEDSLRRLSRNTAGKKT